MLIEGKTAKVGLSVGLPAAVTASDIVIDPIIFIFILIGLIIGSMARIGKLVDDEQTTKAIKKDLFVSLLISLGNGTLALIIITTLGLTYLQGLGVAFVCAFAGLRTIEAAVSSIAGKAFGLKGK